MQMSFSKDVVTNLNVALKPRVWHAQNLAILVREIWAWGLTHCMGQELGDFSSNIKPWFCPMSWARIAEESTDFSLVKGDPQLALRLGEVYPAFANR
jgi:hypothetical protein